MYHACMALLEIFIHQGCASEHPARLVADEIHREFPAWKISVKELGSARAEFLGIFAAPTFVLDGQVVAVGIPRTEWLVRTLRQWIERGS